MDRALWSFVLNTSQSTIPYPWERCYDLMTEILDYKNCLDGSMVIDLRSQVDLGGGLDHVSRMWQDLVGCTCSRHCPVFRRQLLHQEPPHLILATCCGPAVYLLVPEMVSLCPICVAQYTSSAKS